MHVATAVGPRSRTRRNLRAAGAAGLFMLPALALYAVFVLFPIVQAARYSLYDWNGLEPLTDFVGLANFTRALSRSGVPGRGEPQRVHRDPVAGRPDPVRARASR